MKFNREVPIWRHCMIIFTKANLVNYFNKVVQVTQIIKLMNNLIYLTELVNLIKQVSC